MRETRVVGLTSGLEQIGNSHVKRLHKGLQCAQADFFASEFKVGNIVLVDSGLHGKINLPPATLLMRVPYPLSKDFANVSVLPPTP
jgi:hypothetical protein